MSPRRIAVVSGKRGGFGAMLPLMQAIERSPDTELALIVTDQHLSEYFGETVREVERWLRVAHKLPVDQADDRPVSRARAIGRCTIGMAETFDRDRPDLLVVMGDRGEVLAAAVAAVNQGIPVAHIQGGDLSGSVDEFVRHAVTKLSHVHFASTEQSAKRILGMGEEAWRVHVVGDCHLDLIVAGQYTPADRVARKFELDLDRPVILTLQHSVTTEPDRSYAHMKALCDALRHLQHQAVLVYPCSDHGYEGIVRAIEEVRGEQWARIHKNIDAHDFWGLQAVANVFVGNSSAGLIETPSFRLPSVTIGSRQQGRQRAENCIHAEPESDAIIGAIQKCLCDRSFQETVKSCSHPFGDGQAWRRMFGVLSTVELDGRLFDKRMTY